MTQYNKKFYDIQQSLSLQSAKAVLPFVLGMVFQNNCDDKKIIDFGCGVGTWLKAAKEEGVPHVKGIDGGAIDDSILLIRKDEFMSADLTADIQLDTRYDMAFSLEVAEHIPEAKADQYINNLCKAADIILFSAAIPGQGGTGHINEQPLSYWVTKFEARGYRLQDCIRRQFWNDERVGTVYRQNAVLFTKGFANDFAGPDGPLIIDYVHPQLYNVMVERNSRFPISPLFVYAHFPNIYDYMRKHMRRLFRM